MFRQLQKPISTVVAQRAFSSGAFALPPLSYDYAALEPAISGQIMEIHHSKHHQTYVNNLNAVLEQYADAEAKSDITKMIALQPALKFNGGGHLNHSIFWTNMGPDGGEGPTGELLTSINERFGSVEAFKTEFSAKSVAIQGSGWGWLVNGPTGLDIVTQSNQDPVTGAVPLLGLDVWEHAYYLQYQNVRPKYVEAWWNTVNWSNVAERLAASK